MDTAANPLLTPTLRIPFDAVKAEHVSPAIESGIAKAKDRLAELVKSGKTRTFANTLEALDVISEELDFAMGVVSHLESTATYPALREAYNQVLPKVSEFRSSLILDENLWAALQEYAATDEAKKLQGPRERYLKRTITAFRNHGAALPKDKKARLMEIDSELSSITTKFSQNVLDSLNQFEYLIKDEAALDGLPDSARALGQSLAKAKGLDGWRFTLQMPSFIAIMTYLKDRKVREKFFRAYSTVASKGDLSNVDHLYRILELRDEKAKLLGFKDFGDFAVSDRMAQNGAAAYNFVKSLTDDIHPYFEREAETLKAYVRKLEGDSFVLNAWDTTFYAEKLRKAEYDLDEEMLRPYFPLPSVIKGVFDVCSRLFDITVEEVDGMPTWDPSVKVYKVGNSDGSLVGYFYADLFPRENKRGGAWFDSFLTHADGEPNSLPHVGLIAGNFSPPSDGKPALLTHDEVNTLFHEFGHLLHHLFGRVELRGQSMSSVAWDFVEFPSQIMENWCFEREAIDLFARHYETGERIPDALFTKIRKAQNFRRGSFYMRQLSFGTLDCRLHREYNREKDGDILAYSRKHLQQFSIVELPETYAWLCSFNHIFSSPVGYAAGYYSYLWAEVLEADAFSMFVKTGIMNSATGKELRTKILAKGDSEDPMELFKSFVGREPDTKALLVRADLT